eukprot:9270123-Lingulodinium_polyedra.AAC.1
MRRPPVFLLPRPYPRSTSPPGLSGDGPLAAPRPDCRPRPSWPLEAGRGNGSGNPTARARAICSTRPRGGESSNPYGLHGQKGARHHAPHVRNTHR